MQTIQLVLTERCNLNCHYCVSKGTDVLDYKFDNVSIENIKIGDRILGFEENGKFRKVYPTKVLNISRRVEEVIKIELLSGRYIETTRDHPILTPRGNTIFSWREAHRYKKDQPITIFPDVEIHHPTENEDYKIGYIIGVILGDGTIGEYSYKQKYKGYEWVNRQTKIRLAVKDDEIIETVEKYSKDFDINFYRKPFLISKKENLYKDALFSESRTNYYNLKRLVDKNFGKNKTNEYFCGFLSGIYDAEGSISGTTIRISNTDDNIVNEIKEGLSRSGIQYVEESGSRKLKIIRLLSPSRQMKHLEFIKKMEPKCKRKGIQKFYNKFWLSSEAIKNIEYIGKREVYNLETDSKTFFANNIAVHNCYMKNKDTVMTKEKWKEIYEHRLINYDEFEIDLFGGEPLLAFNLIETIYNTLKDDKRCKKINLLSNGIALSQKKADFIKESGIIFNWSFDGLWQDTGFTIQMMKADLIKSIASGVTCMVPPDRKGTSLTRNYLFFLNDLQMIPDFKIVKDNVWSMDDVKKFEEEFIELCGEYEKRLVRKHENCMPGIIKHYLMKTIDGWVGNGTKTGCDAGGSHCAYMPNGRWHPCARYGSDPIYTSSTTYYTKCEGCIIEDICERGCWHSIAKDHGISDELCELYKVIYEQVTQLNHRLKDNYQWVNIIMEMMHGQKS